MFNTYRSFASDQEREGISSSLQQTEEWLYEDGDDETENAYTSKLEDLKKVIFTFSSFVNPCPYSSPLCLSIFVLYSWWIQLRIVIKMRKQEHKLQEIC